MKEFLIGFGAVIAVLMLIAFIIGFSGLIWWGVGSFVIWAFGINFVWTFWHGLALGVITSLLSPTVTIRTKE